MGNSASPPASSANSHSADRNGTSPNRLLDRMRQRLYGFTVLDRYGAALGTVQDVQPDPHQPDRLFYLVVQPQGTVHPQRLHSRALERIDIAARSLSTKVSAAELEPPSAHAPSAAVVDAEDSIVQLLEERLAVNRDKRKVGEVVVRKAVETRWVQVPVRRETLIVEQVGEAARRLAEIDLGEGQVTGVTLADSSEAAEIAIADQFRSVEGVVALLEAIARTGRHRCRQIELELLLSDRDRARMAFEFSAPALAAQTLRAIAPANAQRFSAIHLKLVLADREIQQTYQPWVEHYRSR